jgi:hypothetical protein
MIASPEAMLKLMEYQQGEWRADAEKARLVHYVEQCQGRRGWHCRLMCAVGRWMIGEGRRLLEKFNDEEPVEIEAQPRRRWV